MSKAICFYHGSDFDGMCSGAIVKLADPECELVPYEYGNEFDWEKVKGRQVIMVDASLQPAKEMVKLAETAENLCWIDHHASAEDVVGLIGDRDDVSVSFENGRAGCELAWAHFMPGKKEPRAVTLLGRYDVWDHGYHSHVLPFQYGLRLYDMDPRDPRAFQKWKDLLQSGGAAHITSLVEKGQVALEYQEKYDQGVMEHGAFELKWEGMRAVVVNSAGKGSMQFKSAYRVKDHDIMVTFSWSPKGCWRVGLYATKSSVDCGALAKKHGGGGHAGSAGFQCADLPFKLNVS